MTVGNAEQDPGARGGGRMTRGGAYAVAIAALSVILVAQASVVAVRYIKGRPPRSITGGQMPDVALMALGTHARLSFSEWSPGTCRIAVVVGPTCAVCQRAAATWRERFSAWSDSTGARIVAAWIAVDDSASAELFFAEHPLPGVFTAWMPGESVDNLRRLGTLAVPTVLLVDVGGRVQAEVTGDQFPEPSRAAAACPRGTGQRPERS
jgi:hypothetical protein